MMFERKSVQAVACVLAIGGTLFLNCAFSQIREYEVPGIVPPSPTASAFARYDEIPVDLSTGVPQITIPIYTIKSKLFEIPLTLSYHASGIRVNDVSSPVGLGWVISGMTGLVSRTVLDRPDEDSVKYGHGWGGKAVYSSKEKHQAKVNEVVQTNGPFINFGEELFTDLKYKDKQADRYNYQLPGSGSGTFRYDFTTSDLVIMPYRPIKVEHGVLVNDEIPSFTIIDERGTKYTFDKPFKSQQENGYCSYCYNGTANTSWYLSQIESADKTDVIEYQYTGALNAYTTGNFSDTYIWGIFDPEYGVQGGDRINPMLSENYRSGQFTTTFEPLLSQIVSSTTIVKFAYADDRQDMPDAPFRLSTITVIDRVTGKTIKTVSFDNDHYFGGYDQYWGTQRLRLNGITINDVRGGNTYTFGYIGGDLSGPNGLPPYNTLERWEAHGSGAQTLTFAEDFWGYYNGANHNKGLVPLEFVLAPLYHSLPHYWGNRRPNAESAQIWTLNKINYPTGGETQFFYEGNRTQIHDIGGLRVRKIVNWDNETSSSTAKVYSYSGGYAPRPLSAELFSYKQYYNWDFEGCAYPEEFNGGTVGSPIFHPSTAPTRWTTNSSSFCGLTLSSGAPVIYTHVTEVTIDPVTEDELGKIEYTFDQPEYWIPETYDRTNGQYWHDIGSYVPPLLSKKVFKKTAGGTFELVQETLNTYTNYFDQEYHMGVDVFQSTYDIDNGTGNHVETGYLIGQSCSGDINPAVAEYLLYMHVLKFNNHTATRKVQLLTETIEKNHVGSEVITTTKEVEYNLSNLQPSVEEVTQSDGTILRTEYKYPSDFPTDPVCAEMVNRNIITGVIETLVYKDNAFLQSSKTNYVKDWAGNNELILPQTIDSKMGTHPQEIRIRYHEYDQEGNVLLVSAEDDVLQAYVWGYDQSLPVAKVVNARAKDIYYTSFEEGQFNVSQPAKTGVKNSGGPFSKTLTTLSNGEYELSYWKYEGSPVRWVRHVQNVTISNSTSGSNGTYTINLSGAPIDEIRFHPQDAQMTTFTYQPLVGVTSVTDPGGLTTYYEYDHEGRLTAIRDQDQKLTQKIGYSFRGSPENLIEGAYYNNVRVGRFMRNNCETGYTGTEYTYVVPAFKHYSLVSQEDADLLAEMDVANNGQAQANLQGDCIPAFGNSEQSATFQPNCPSGQTGVPITYTVRAGKYRATTQAGADQLAAQDIATNGQAFANEHGICYDDTLPFVTLTYEDPTTQTVTVGGQQFENFYQDVVIKFYEDPERTIPMNVSNVQVTIERNWYLDDQYGTETQTFTVSGTSFVIYNDYLFWGYDSNGKFHEESFVIKPGAGYHTF